MATRRPATGSEAPTTKRRAPARRRNEAGTTDDPPLGRTPITELYRGYRRLRLIRDLAMGEWTVASIADREGVDASDLEQFVHDHEQDINEVRQALAGQLALETSGLWVSKKQNRLAELQGDIEDLNSVLDEMRAGTYTATDSDGRNLGSRRHHSIVRSKIQVLRAVADELSPRNTGNFGDPSDPNIVHYVIEAGPIGDALT